MSSLTLGYSPCPNDTFIFTAWSAGWIPDAPPVTTQFEDIETLNSLTGAGKLDVAKVSFHAYGYLRDRYALLHAGGALGRGCGPLVVGRRQYAREELDSLRIAIPGERTTAALLLGLYRPESKNRVVMPFHQILSATRDGIVDAGLIIHESRFTYAGYGLKQVVDLGEWWEAETGHAIPLGGIVIRRDLGSEIAERVDRALAASVRYAYDHRARVWPTIRRHAQEMDDEVMRKHIELYVNGYTEDYGPDGEAAIRYLYGRAEELGVIPPTSASLFWDES